MTNVPALTLTTREEMYLVEKALRLAAETYHFRSEGRLAAADERDSMRRKAELCTAIADRFRTVFQLHLITEADAIAAGVRGEAK